MNSRERILNSIDHKEPDKVPIDLGATPSSGISAIAYSNLKRTLNLSNGHIRVYDVVQQLAQPEDEILNLFKIDVVDIGRIFNTEDEDWYDITLANGDAAQYPGWFRPKLELDGSWNAFTRDGTHIAKMPLNVSVLEKYF